MKKRGRRPPGQGVKDLILFEIKQSGFINGDYSDLARKWKFTVPAVYNAFQSLIKAGSIISSNKYRYTLVEVKSVPAGIMQLQEALITAYNEIRELQKANISLQKEIDELKYVASREVNKSSELDNKIKELQLEINKTRSLVRIPSGD